jgi:nucleotide-binding universal stress UspA family protein
MKQKQIVMKKILFPTDYSETANNAFKYALQLADFHQADLYVLHVYDPPVISGPISPTLVDNVIKKHEFEKLEQIHAHSPTLNKIREDLGLQHVETFFKVKEGLLIPEIQNAIKENEIDFIVMGTDGNSGFHKKILGTNTINTISKVNIPVLSIPKEASYKKVESVIFTTLFSKDEEATLDVIVQNATERNMTIKCVHITQPNCFTCDDVYQHWKEKYKNLPITFHIFSAADTAKNLLTFIQNETVDVVAIVQRSKGFFESFFAKSTTQRLAKQLKIPFFVYKAQLKE